MNELFKETTKQIFVFTKKMCRKTKSKYDNSSKRVKLTIRVIFIFLVIWIVSSIFLSPKGPAYGSKIKFTKVYLNNRNVGNLSPVLTVQAGKPIKGDISFFIKRRGPEEPIFTVAGTCSWDPIERKTLSEHLNPGKHNLTYNFSHQAPSNPGSYWIVITAGPFHDISEMFDGLYNNNIWDWDNSQYLQAFDEKPVDITLNGHQESNLLACAVKIQVIPNKNLDQKLTSNVECSDKTEKQTDNNQLKSDNQTKQVSPVKKLYRVDLDELAEFFLKESLDNLKKTYSKLSDGWYLIEGELEVIPFGGHKVYGIKGKNTGIAIGSANALDYWFPTLRDNVGKHVLVGAEFLGGAIMMNNSDAEKMKGLKYPVKEKRVMNAYGPVISGIPPIKNTTNKNTKEYCEQLNSEYTDFIRAVENL